MTVTINGSGTMTGLAVGGLNDNIITPAELSTGAPSWDSSGNLSFNSGYGSVATAYACRAWVNFNGTGTVAIRASGNVSSITDNGTGSYTVNFSTALPDSNYSVMGTSDQDGNGQAVICLVNSIPPTSSGCRITTMYVTVGAQDHNYNTVSFVR